MHAQSRVDSAPETGPSPPAARSLRAPVLLAAAFLFAVAVLAIVGAPASAAVNVTATITPVNPVEDTIVTVRVTIVNLDNVTETNLQIKVLTGNTQVGIAQGVNLPPYGNITVNVTFTAKIPTPLDEGKGITIQVERIGNVNIGSTGNIPPYSLYRVSRKPVVTTPFPIIPVAIVAAGGAAVVVFLFMRKRKADEVARLTAEAAAKADVERRVAAETARELAVTQKIHGKYPAEYFQRRRARLAQLVPTGLTSAGLTVLQRKVAEVKKIVFSCPRCGTHKEAFDAPCPRCSVQDSIEALRAEVKKHRTGADFSDVGNLLQQAEFQLSYSSFGEAGVLVDQARTAFNEILAGGERTVKVKRMETISAADGKPTVLDLGSAAQHTVVDTAAEEQEHELREEYARESTHCPTCGHAMYGDLCAYCHFDDYATLVADTIAQASKAGAETVEPRDLLERARKMREEDNKSTASRYLNRARYLAGKHLHDHLASKAEGMIDYARTLMLVGEEDGFTADFAEAEATLARAEEKRIAGDAAAAVEIAGQAEGQIHIALHALNKQVAIKRIDQASKDIDDARGKGANVAAAEAMLKEARASFDTGEFERARDQSGDIKKALLDATKGKAVCPKCGKPTQPQWARCPFCTTPLK